MPPLSSISRLVAVLLFASACGDNGITPPTADAGADSGIDAAAPATRVQLHTQERADLIDRGTSLLRLSVPVDAPIAEVSNRDAWTLRHGVAPIPSSGGELLVFPSMADSSRAALAVWLLLPTDVRAGEVVTGTLSGRAVLEATVGITPILGRVEVQPVVVRDPAGGGPARTAEQIAAQFSGFAPLLATSCNIELGVRAPASVEVAGFDRLLAEDIISVDDAEIISLLRGATGETVGLLLSERLDTLHDAADAVVGVDRGVVRAYVLGQHQSPEQANAIVPSYFHTELASLFAREPYYLRELPFFSHDPALPLLDESVVPPRIGQELLRLSPVATERAYALYFGDDHTEAFAHELGHVLGLPHPFDSTVIDARTGVGGAPNLMDNSDECLPGCVVRISPQQCEIMLLGFTGFLRAT